MRVSFEAGTSSLKCLVFAPCLFEPASFGSVTVGGDPRNTERNQLFWGFPYFKTAPISVSLGCLWPGSKHRTPGFCRSHWVPHAPSSCGQTCRTSPRPCFRSEKSIFSGQPIWEDPPLPWFSPLAPRPLYVHRLMLFGRRNWPLDFVQISLAEASLRLLLCDGDLCTMEGMVQKHYQHRVPPEGASERPRINLTWRYIVKHTPRCPRRNA